MSLIEHLLSFSKNFSVMRVFLTNTLETVITNLFRIFGRRQSEMVFGGSLTCSWNASIPSTSSCVRPLRYAVLGGGFAGLSVAWHLLKQSRKEMNLRIDIYDEVGIGGGASGVSGGLLHPYSPKVKLLWRGAECWKECLELLSVAEVAAAAASSMISRPEFGDPVADFGDDKFIVRRRGILRPATSVKNLDVMNENAQNCNSDCRIETLDMESTQKLVPDLCVPYNLAFYMPQAVNVHPMWYLQALFLACQNMAKELSTSSHGQKELFFHKKSVGKLLDLEGEYDAVIVCLGAKADTLPELSGRLPLRTCRGVIAHLQLPDNMREGFPEHSPSILSDAWLAFQGTHSLYLGSTWEWKSRNSSTDVSADEASKALEELLPKVSVFYPGITDWTCTRARAGLRAMPPLTTHGSLPLLGCVNDFVGENCTSKYWLFAGLGSRGLLYHAWLGNLTAKAVLSCNERVIPPELTGWRNKVG